MIMAKLKIYLFVFLGVCSTVLGQSAPSAPLTIPVEGKPDTSLSTPTTMPAPTKSTSTSTTTPPAPTTSTSTTTPPPTTSSSTTTPAPPTTSSTAPPPPSVGTWFFTNSTTNITCIVLQFAATLNVTYNTRKVDNGTDLRNSTLTLPVDAEVTAGECGAARQWLRLQWPASGAPGQHALSLQWAAADDRSYHLSAVNVTLLRDDHFPNATWETLELSQAEAEWVSPARGSYRCAHTSLALTEADGAVAALVLTSLQEEAFRTQRGHQFSAAVECGGGEVPDAVPIAVGCALGALVLLVLGAYLIGRRRAQQPGYLSM